MSHLLQQLQLLVFAGLAFMGLWWFRLYPKDQAGVILDVEWIWRKAGPVAGRAMAGPLRRAGWFVSGLVSTTIAGLQAAARQVFAAEGVVSRKVPLAATAIWAVCILGLVLLISLFG
jgi:multicomponent Na+:H+ antiporter subunit D